MQLHNITRTPGKFLILLFAATLAACSGSGGSSEPPPPPPSTNAGTVALSLASDSAAEDAGAVRFSVSRSTGSDGVVEVEVRVAGGSADPGTDYNLSGTAVQFGDGDAASRSGEVMIMDDNQDEPAETVELEIIVVRGDAALGAATATLTIVDNDDPPPPSSESGYGLNDTGTTLCVDSFGTEFACDAPEVVAFPGQDATGGRDVSEPSDADGHAGFVLSKLDANGFPLVDQSADYATNPWDCVQDHVTGLVWEVKTADGGLRDMNNTFFWRRARSGEPPSETGQASCSQLPDCGIRDYISTVNASGLCGLGNWRIPSRHELLSIVDFGSPTVIAIDEAYFPNTAPKPYWTDTRSLVTGDAAYVEFDEGISLRAFPWMPLRVRLVSGGY